MNGKIERAAGYIVTRTRAMMIALKIPERFWPFVMDSVVVVLNLLPSEANDKMASPHELLATGLNMPDEAKMPYIRHLRSYYCHAYYYIKPEKRDKAEKFIPRAKKGRLIGYGDRHGKIYWIWNEDRARLFVPVQSGSTRDLPSMASRIPRNRSLRLCSLIRLLKR